MVLATLRAAVSDAWLLLAPQHNHYKQTQDLRHARMIVWAPDPDKLSVPNKTAEFFAEFSDHITLRRFDYDAAIAGTPFVG